MSANFSKGEPGVPCDRCQTTTAPSVQLFTVEGNDSTVVTLCVICLAHAIDLPTGWRITNQMFQMLGISDASARFLNPLQSKPRNRHRTERRSKKWSTGPTDLTTEQRISDS